MRLITITTDFGDQFAPAQLKAVLYSMGFDGHTIENHSVKKYSITEAAFQIKTLAKYCPKNTIHIGVVDPGVGSSRAGIIIKTKKGYFVGPDNGLLYPAALREKIACVWKIDEKYFGKISKTFHGRDVFAKCAALLAQGQNPKEFNCEELDRKSLTKLKFKNGQVLHIDHYGNIKVHWNEKVRLNKNFMLNRNGRRHIIPVTQTFSEVEPGAGLAYHGSSETLELGINLGNAAAHWNINQDEILNIYEQS